MRVEQNNFRDMFSVYLSGPPQTQHVFCVSPAARVAHTGLAGEERLKAFPLQIFQTVMVGMYAYRSLREMCRSSQNTGYMAYQFFMCQRTVTAYLVCSITKTTG